MERCRVDQRTGRPRSPEVWNSWGRRVPDGPDAGFERVDSPVEAEFAVAPRTSGRWGLEGQRVRGAGGAAVWEDIAGPQDEPRAKELLAFAWLVGHIVCVLNMYQLGSGGKAPILHSKRRKTIGNTLAFGDVAMFRVSGKVQGGTVH